MNQLDDATRRALCAGDQPPPGVEDRVLAAILAPLGPLGSELGPELGAGEAVAPTAAVGKAAGGGLAYGLKVIAATVGLTAAGLGVLAGGAHGVRALTETPAARSDAAAQVEAERPRGAASGPAPARPAPAPSATSTVTPPKAEQAPVAPVAPAGRATDPAVKSGTASPTANPAGSPSAGAGPVGPASEGVEAELALLRQARRATDPEAALTLLDQHAARFADGVLAGEREVLRIEKLCALGRTQQAAKLSAAFVAARPDDPLRSRAEAGCSTLTQPGTESAGAGHRNQ